MIKFSWRVGVSCLFVGLLVSHALAQNPTLKLIPAANSTQRCLGGPEHGELCGTTANCELDNFGVIHPECQRVCATGDDAGDPCSDNIDCQNNVCQQQCFCNRWITNPPAFFSMQVRGTNWSPDGQALKAFQADVNWRSACDAIVPFGWDKPCEPINCLLPENCPAATYPNCNNQECEGTNHNPECFSFICSVSPPCNTVTCPGDYVFSGLSELAATSTSDMTFKFGSTLLGQTGVSFVSERYFGTLPLLRKEDGCGTVSFGFSSTSVLLDENVREIGPLDLEGITLVLPACIPTALVSSEPTRCTIDGRQGSEPDGTFPAGWTTLEVELDVANAAGTLVTDFTMREVPGVGIGNPTGIQNNVPELGWVTLTFPPTNPGVWTCIKFKNDAAGEVCLGGLPGDFDGDGVAEAADVPPLVECIDGNAPCELSQCDTNRSGVCGASDLVRQIDLLNKAEGYSGLPSELPECPNPPNPAP